MVEASLVAAEGAIPFCSISSSTEDLKAPSEFDESPSGSEDGPSGRLRSLSRSSAYESELLNQKNCLQFAYEFPWLTDSELKEYKTYTRTCFDLKAIGPITFFITVFYVAHANFENALSDGPFFTAGLSFGLIASILFYIIFIFAHGVRTLSNDIAENSFMNALSSLIFYSIYLEDVIAVVATMSASSYLYARVLKGQCHPDVTIWGSQRCNPVAASHSIPTDQVFYVYIFPLMHQLILRGISIRAVFACWIISTGTIIMSVIEAKAWLELWTIFVSLFTLCIAYEHERFCRVCFIQSKMVAEAEEQRRKRMVHHQEMEHDLSLRNMEIERNNYEMEIISIRSEEQSKRMVCEHAQMVSLIGNVAHDLKTPLQSVGIDLESLKAKLVAVNSILLQWFSDKVSFKSNSTERLSSDDCDCQIHKNSDGSAGHVLRAQKGVVSGGQSGSHQESDEAATENDILSLIDGLKEGVTSVDYSCTFMKSAINRSLDFTKATKNIALSPSISPFDIRETLTWPLKCVTSMQTDVTVTMAPIDDEISMIIISDKHWLIENALCLLSNAVKYSSEGGTVRLIIELVRMSRTDVEGIRMEPVKSTRLNESCSELSPDHSASGTPVFACSSVNFSHQTLVLAVARAKMNERAISVQLASAVEVGVQLMIRLTVEDTGIGIPDDVKKNLFQPFSQAQRFAGGTGLGLFSLAKRIDALEGKYGVRDRDDGKSGTVFWFAFPYRPDFTASPTSPFNEMSEISSGQQTAKKGVTKRGAPDFANDLMYPLNPATYGARVLIVDDSMTILRVTSRALTDAGFVVDTARNGFIGLNKMLSTTFPNADATPAQIVSSEAEPNNAMHRSGQSDRSTITATSVNCATDAEQRDCTVGAHVEVAANVTGEVKAETEIAIQNGAVVSPNLSLSDNTSDEDSKPKKDAGIVTQPSPDNFPFDFILMDIQMPVMDGIEATLRLRARENAQHLIESNGKKGDSLPWAGKLVIIGMSANSDAETRRLAHEAGMQYFLPKPFTIAEFRALLESIRNHEQ